MYHLDVPDPVLILRENSHPGCGCVVVLGQPRGGTSVVAGFCHLIGVRMGREIDPNNMEAKEFLGLSTFDNFHHRFESALAALKSDTKLFGFKDPTAIDYWPQISDLVPDPILIVVLRDAAAIAGRQQHDGGELSNLLANVASRQYALLRLGLESDLPTAIVSYERLIQNPSLAFEKLSQFVSGNVSVQIADKIHETVNPHADMPNEINFLKFGARFGLTSP